MRKLTKELAAIAVLVLGAAAQAAPQRAGVGIEFNTPQAGTTSPCRAGKPCLFPNSSDGEMYYRRPNGTLVGPLGSGGGGGSFYQAVEDASGTLQTQRAIIELTSGLTAVDDAGGARTQGILDVTHANNWTGAQSFQSTSGTDFRYSPGTTIVGDATVWVHTPTFATLGAPHQNSPTVLLQGAVFGGDNISHPVDYQLQVVVDGVGSIGGYLGIYNGGPSSPIWKLDGSGNMTSQGTAKIHGYVVDPGFTAPTPGQVLAWDGAQYSPSSSASINGLLGAYQAAADTAHNIMGLTTGLGPALVRDNATPITGTLFGVQSSSGATKYLDVAAATTTIGTSGGLAALSINDTTGARLLYGSNAITVETSDISVNANFVPTLDKTDKLGNGGATPHYFASSHVYGDYSVSNTVTYTTTPTFDPANGRVQTITLTGNISSWSVTAPPSATLGGSAAGSTATMTIIFIQDATGGRTLAAPPANVKLTGGALTLSTGANGRDSLSLVYDAQAAVWQEDARALASSGSVNPQFQDVYNNGSAGTNQNLTLDSSRNGLVYHDGSTPVTGPLWSAQSNATTANGTYKKYWDVTATGADMTGQFGIGATAMTSTAGLSMASTTLAAAGAQERSPWIKLGAQGWKTASGGASIPVEFAEQVLPVQGSSNPTGQWNLYSQINSAGWTNILQVSDLGVITDPQTGAFTFKSSQSDVASNVAYVFDTAVIPSPSTSDLRLMQVSAGGVEAFGFELNANISTFHIGHTNDSNGATITFNDAHQQILGSAGAITLRANFVNGQIMNGTQSSWALGQKWKTVSKSANYTIAASDHYILCTAGGFTLTLPSPATAASGAEYFIIDTGRNFNGSNLTLARNGAESINGTAGSATLTVNGGVYKVVTDGANWFVTLGSQTL